MESDWISVFVRWLPFLVLFGVWFFLSRSVGMRAKSPSGASMIELYEQQVAETRKMNAMLERIAVTLEKHEPVSR